MRERGDSPIDRGNRYLDIVNYQAQKAILNPTMPGEIKDEILDNAVEIIHQVAERKAAYFAKYGEGRKTRAGIPHVK